ncbi:MAG TPA: hypothetical protein VFW87_23325 [Pirellulales bacterium]|nr:hypothetical protein [Pirellulales bacterium]
MKTLGKLVLMASVAALWSVQCSTANAQMGMGGYALGYGFLGNGPYNNLYDAGPIPYYSLNPPVYYSQPVPRTYGYSPFAYPPGYLTPEIEWEQPKVMVNPHVPQKSSAPARRSTLLDRTTAAPKRIVNPYVDLELAASAAPGDERLAVDASSGELVDNARRRQ